MKNVVENIEKKLNVIYVKRCLIPIIKINIQKQGIMGKKVKHSYVLEGQTQSHQSDCEPRNIFLRDV